MKGNLRVSKRDNRYSNTLSRTKIVILGRLPSNSKDRNKKWGLVIIFDIWAYDDGSSLYLQFIRQKVFE